MGSLILSSRSLAASMMSFGHVLESRVAAARQTAPAHLSVRAALRESATYLLDAETQRPWLLVTHKTLPPASQILFGPAGKAVQGTVVVAYTEGACSSAAHLPLTPSRPMAASHSKVSQQCTQMQAAGAPFQLSQHAADVASDQQARAQVFEVTCSEVTCGKGTSQAYPQSRA